MPSMRKDLIRSPQWRNGRFRNEVPWKWMSGRDYLGMMWDYVVRSRDGAPRRSLPRMEPDLSAYMSSARGHLSATWLGHSTLLLNVDGIQIITDPVLVKGITLLGPWRYSGPPVLTPDQIPEAHIAIISHNHFDHLNEYTLRRIHDRVKRFVTPIGVGGDLVKCGIPPKKIVELDWWEEYEDPAGVRLTATPAQHFSGRGMTDRDRTLWASFVIQGANHKVFFGGDSGYFEGFKRIGEKCGPFDICFIETGAYSRYWHAVHMFPEEAVQAHIDLRGTVLHPIHWGTFNLSLHAWYDPMRRLAAEARKKGVQTATPVQGETTVYPEQITDREWWEEIVGSAEG